MGSVHPMNLRETFQYEAINRDSGPGRLIEHTAADGIATRYAYNLLGQTISRQQVRAERVLGGTLYKMTPWDAPPSNSLWWQGRNARIAPKASTLPAACCGKPTG